MRKSNVERLRESKAKAQPQTELEGVEGLLTLLLGGPLLRTQRQFIYDTDRIKGYKGPAGCAKSSTLAAIGLSRALLQPGSKGFVSRNDYNDLQDTTVLVMQEMLNRLPKGVLLDRDKSPPMKWWIRPAVEGDPSEITFMGLADDVVGIKANWWLVDEMNEVVENRIHQINARLRAEGGDYLLAGAFNPPDKHHWLYTACTGNDFQDKFVKKPWMKLYEPQAKENVVNLPEGYYETLAETMPEDQRMRYVDGEWGSDFGGQPVYREFKYGLHVRDGLKFDKSQVLYRFWDFGYARPACIWAQLTYEGHLLILREHMGHNVEVGPFADYIKAQTVQRFPHPRGIVDFGDPAVVQKKDTGSTLGELWKHGIQMQYQSSTIEKGLKLVRHRFTTLIDGEPAVQIDRAGCPILVSAVRGGYALDKKGEKPVKDGYYDHLADTFRYGVLNIDNGGYTVGEDLPTSVATVPTYNLPTSVALGNLDD